MRRAPFLICLLAALTGACNRRDDGPVNVSVIGGPDAFAEMRGVRLGPAAQLLRAATVEGLVGFDAEGRVVPALADRWIVTEDGQSYIFRLRNGEWPDGKPITGESTASALRRTIASLRRTALARDLGVISEIRAMAGRVVEVRLSTPIPDLLDLLAQPELGLPWKNRGTGPMTLTRQGGVAELSPIPPEARGLPAEEGWAERVRGLRIRPEPAASAVARFDEGYADIVLGGTADTLPLVAASGLSRGNLRLDPVIGLFGLAVVSRNGLFAEPQAREAIAMAIDREALVGEFNVGGWVPTTRSVSPEAADDLGTVGERWVGLNISARQRIAAGRVARWSQTGKSPGRVRIALPATPGGTIIWNRLRLDLEAIGLRSVRVQESQSADLRLFDAVARYGRVAWFLNQLSCAAGRPVCSAEGDARLAEALAAPDARTRAALQAQAETEITAANGFIPFARPLRWSLVRGDITGFAINPWGLHPLLPLALAPK
jgi:peptide/nickel transport system substrate-binding protein/oligopeptide transport system substrate-binding protein